MTTTRRAAMYVRISRDKAGAGLGVDRQREDCQALADRLGWNVVEVYSDNDLSAYSGKARPGYRKMLDDIEAGVVDAIIAWHPDRLHRRPAELEEFIAAVDTAGALISTVTAGDLDLATPSGRMVARILGSVAREEVEHSIERQVRAKQQAASDGRYRGGRRPFGYESDGCTVRAAEAAVAVEVAERVLAGESLRSLAAELNTRRVLTSTGGEWKSTELRRMLLRARNAALVEHDGEVVGPAQWPPILNDLQWRRVRALLTSPGRVRPRSADEVYLGSGVYVCGICGDTMRAGTTPGRRVDGQGRLIPAYRCRTAPHLTRAAKSLDAFVSELAVERLSRPDAQRTLITQAESLVDLDALTGERTVEQKRLSELAALFAAGSITGSQLAEGTEIVRAKIDRMDRELATVAAKSALSGIVDADDVRAAWEAVPVGRRKAAIRELMSITLLRAPRGRPKGWRPGDDYFDPSAVRVEWHR